MIFRAAAWRSASRCGNTTNTANCVQVNLATPGLAGVRDSKSGGDQPVLIFSAGRWSQFVGAVCDSR
ncbi:DUF397 domain-containing protein [Actinosynnema sp. ALI-1.44]|uniref:DUF397 domain-containing protein n=1 Tax=Actinosynnema sp. ALI-1.44 TaxID=1933779 RepID=UPI001EDBE9CE|nr:DUF397 domain-containing protein [Actinosynnema sp. ALI-1.44]